MKSGITDAEQARIDDETKHQANEKQALSYMKEGKRALEKGGSRILAYSLFEQARRLAPEVAQTYAYFLKTERVVNRVPKEEVVNSDESDEVVSKCSC